MDVEPDVLLDALAQAIASNDDVDGMPIVTEYVAVAAFTDRYGESHVFTGTLEDQRNHTTMGLLSFALTIQQAEVATDNG